MESITVKMEGEKKGRDGMREEKMILRDGQ